MRARAARKTNNSVHKFKFTRNIDTEAGNSVVLTGGGGGTTISATNNSLNLVAASGGNTVYNLITVVPNLSKINAGVSTMINNFDYFRLSKVVLKIYPTMTENTQPGQLAPEGVLWRFHSKYDFDGDGTITTASEANLKRIMRSPYYKVKKGNRNMTWIWKPRWSFAAINNAGAAQNVGVGPSKRWLDVNVATLDHFGLYIIAEGTNQDAANTHECKFRCEITYYMQARQPLVDG